MMVSQSPATPSPATTTRLVPSRSGGRRLRPGFTLIELLAVIGVIAVLVSLILPAVQNAREAARRTACRNNLKQIALAAANHQSLNGHFPANGWGYQWIGEPTRGYGREQPGGWIYNLLPHLEQGPLRELGRDATPADRRARLTELSRTPLAMFDCPSRPGGTLQPANPAIIPFNADWIPLVAKTDYAVNEGDFITDTPGGPPTLFEGDHGYAWRNTSPATGISYLRSRVKPADITDGLSNTYLVGEKYVPTAYYDDAGDPGHDQSLFSGVDLDLNRWVIDIPLPDGDWDAPRRFGSAHRQVCHFAFCDGSVKGLGYNVNPAVHGALGNRRDGKVVSVD